MSRLYWPVFGLAVVNLALLGVVLVLVLGRPAILRRAGDAPVLRAGAIELVDAGGQVRAQLQVEPDGEVVFRLRDEAGTTRVKLGAGRHGSGLLLLDETTEPGIQLIARRTAAADRHTTTSLNLFGPEGQRKVITP
jgi:hypothetical protein